MKIREDAIKQAKTNLNSINISLEDAEKANPAEAAKIYRSIIELYGSMNKATNPEVRVLVEKANELLAEIQPGQQVDSNQDAP